MTYQEYKALFDRRQELKDKIEMIKLDIENVDYHLELEFQRRKEVIKQLESETYGGYINE